MIMLSAILDLALTTSFIAISARLIISAIIVMMMVRRSNPDTNPNPDCCLSIYLRETEKHTCDSQNQPDLLFHRCHPVKFIAKD